MWCEDDEESKTNWWQIGYLSNSNKSSFSSPFTSSAFLFYLWILPPAFVVVLINKSDACFSRLCSSGHTFSRLIPFALSFWCVWLGLARRIIGSDIWKGQKWSAKKEQSKFNDALRDFFGHKKLVFSIIIIIIWKEGRRKKVLLFFGGERKKFRVDLWSFFWIFLLFFSFPLVNRSHISWLTLLLLLVPFAYG